MMMFCRRMAGLALAGYFLASATVQAATERVVYRFRGVSDGAFPLADLLELGGVLYGTTQLGGGGSCENKGRKVGCGIVFAIIPNGLKSATEKVIYAFKGGPYGGGDGANPESRLISIGDTFYGTTFQGGASGFGTVFSLTPAGVEKLLYSFQGGTDGGYPVGGLIDVGGKLYGTTSGTVYSIDLKTGTERVLHNFGSGSDGAGRTSDLVKLGGMLYGVTEGGGSAGLGTVYSITTGGLETVLHSFLGGSDGDGPNSALRKIDGTLYGTTFEGGVGNEGFGYGVIFSVIPGGNETVLYAFTGKKENGFPGSDLTKSGSMYYGTTEGGGEGTVYSITPAGVETVVHSFKGGHDDGTEPYAGLTPLHGKLFGTTSGEGRAAPAMVAARCSR